MKKSLLALAVMSLAAGSAFATGNHNQSPAYVVAGAAGSNNIVSGSVAGAAASGTGSATSSSFNQGFAATGVSVSGAVDAKITKNTVVTGPGVWLGTSPATRTTVETKSGSVGVEGYTVTANMSGAKTTQSGSALAGAAAGGISTAVAGGAGTFDTGSGQSPTGNVAGASHALTASGAASVGNGSNFQNAGMASDFGAQASADIKTTTVQTGGAISGHFFSTAQPSQNDVKNAATSAYGNAVSTGGFAVTAPYANAGTAVGGVINNATGGAVANASVGGVVSAYLLGL